MFSCVLWLYTNRVFFTYLYLDNTTGMTHLKTWSDNLWQALEQTLTGNEIQVGTVPDARWVSGRLGPVPVHYACYWVVSYSQQVSAQLFGFLEDECFVFPIPSRLTPGPNKRQWLPATLFAMYSSQGVQADHTLLAQRLRTSGAVHRLPLTFIT